MRVWTVYDALYENVVGVFSSEEAADDFGAWYGRLWHDNKPEDPFYNIDIEEWTLDADLKPFNEKKKAERDYHNSPEGRAENKRRMDLLLAMAEARKEGK